MSLIPFADELKVHRLTERQREQLIADDATPCDSCGHSRGIHVNPDGGDWWYGCNAPRRSYDAARFRSMSDYYGQPPCACFEGWA